MSNDQWSDLETLWRSDMTQSDPAASARRVERSLRFGRWSRAAFAALALVLLVAAMGHAVSPIEAAVGLGAGLAISVAWVMEIVAQRRQRTLLSQPTMHYVESRSGLLRAQLRGLRFVWLVAVLALLFLLPWWIEGIPIHFGSFMSLVAVFSFWLPVTVIFAFLAWTVKRALSMSRELRALSASKALD